MKAFLVKAPRFVGVTSTWRRLISTTEALGGKSSKERNSDGQNNDGLRHTTVSPSTIQVFSDPALASTVRQVAVSIQKIKGILKSIREESEDTTIEILRQSQKIDSFEKAMKETEKIVKESKTQIPNVIEGFKMLEENVVYFSKMVGNQENKILDFNKRMEQCEGRLDKISSSLENLNKVVGDLMKFPLQGVQEEATKAFVEAKISRKDCKGMKQELASIRNDINKLKTMSEK